MSTPQKRAPHWLIRLTRIVLPVIIITAGIAFAKHLYDTKPVARRGKPSHQPPLVEIMSLEKRDHTVILTAMGSVIPSRSISLKSRVNGYVVDTAKGFVPGGLFHQGEVMLKLDTEDFKLAVKQQQALLEKVKASLELEMGRQEVAKAELKLMQHTTGKSIEDTNLALRVPQLEQIKADIAAIRVDLRRARLNLQRTVIHAPFNCMVMTVNVEIGSSISSQEILAGVTGTDAYRVEAAVPVDHLRWMHLPIKHGGSGSAVEITTKEGSVYQGKVVRLLGDLSGESQMARILIRIVDPLGLRGNNTSSANASSANASSTNASSANVFSANASSANVSSANASSANVSSANVSSANVSPLLLGCYVQAAIHGKTIESVILLPRRLARDGGQVWLMEENRLLILDIEVLWKNREYLFVKQTNGIMQGRKIVVSQLSSAVDGMAVRINGKEKITPDGANVDQTGKNLPAGVDPTVINK